MSYRGPERRKKPEFRRAVTFLWWEAAFAIAYDTCVGPGVLSALAGEKGVALSLVALINSLPWMGQLAQLGGAALLGRVRSLRRTTVLLAGLARSLWIVPFAAGVWAVTRGEVFPGRAWFAIAACAAALAAPLASSSAVLWYAWIKALVPAGMHGRFLGVRHKYVMISTIAANALAFTIVGWSSGDMRLGFLALVGAGVLSGALSTTLLSRVPDARPKRGGPDGIPSASIPIFAPLADREFRRLLLFGMAFHGAVYFAGPYFPYYFTHDLGFSTGTVSFWAAIASVGNLCFAGFWGRRVDRAKDILPILRVCVFGITLSPFPYIFAGREAVAWLAPFEYFVNGASWSGYFIVFTSLLFRKVPPGTGARYFTLYSACIGGAGALATWVGQWASVLLRDLGGFPALWAVGGALRLGVGIVGLSLLSRRRP